MAQLKSTSIFGTIKVHALTEATSIDTGALKVSGGVGIKKALFVGKSLNVAENITVSGKINKLTITPPTTGSTLTIADGLTLSVSGASKSFSGIGTGIVLNTTPTINALTNGHVLYASAANTISSELRLNATRGGTGIGSYAVGDLLYAGTTTTLSKRADIVIGNVLLSGGVGVAPIYGKVGLTTHISGTLAVGNGGTGATTFTSGNVLIGATTGAITTLSRNGIDTRNDFPSSAHTLDSHSNTTITLNSTGELLKWNGTAWVNNTLAEAGIATSGHIHTDHDRVGTVLTGANVFSGLTITDGIVTAETIRALTPADIGATTETYVNTAISNLVSSSPATLDTLNELAAALGDDPNFATTVTTSIGTKLTKASNLIDLTNIVTARTNLGVDIAGTINYVHPTYTARTETGDTGILSGATIISDLDFNMTSDALGHITNFDITTLATRELTLLDLGYTGSETANDYVHPTYIGDNIDVDTTPLTGATVVSDIDFNITTDITGHVTNANGVVVTRDLNLADLGYTGTADANTYVHPAYTGDDISIDTTPLTGATVVSDIDFNITTDMIGHVTDANGTVVTRDLTLADLGYIGADNANFFTYTLPDATSTIKGGITFNSALATDTKFLRGDGIWTTPSYSTYTYTLPTATDLILGGVKIGAGITIASGTISHTDTSTQTSVNNSGRTFIQDITLDTYGHITGITSATDADTYVGTVTNITVTSPLTVSTSTTTPALAMPAATTSVNGYMTSAWATKLNGIATGAEVNVQADWNATEGDALILNKPSTYAPSSHTHDDRYYTETESNAVFANVTGDTITGVISITNTTASTSTITGALKVSGGLGVAGDIWAAKVHNAVWNDIADFVEIDDNLEIEYGKVYFRDKDSKVKLASKKGQYAIGIASDTFGFGVGEDNRKKQMPVAIGGWILAHVDNVYIAGTPLIPNKNGVLTKATWIIEIFKSSSIIAHFDRVEKKELWNGVEVNGRYWVKVK